MQMRRNAVRTPLPQSLLRGTEISPKCATTHANKTKSLKIAPIKWQCMPSVRGKRNLGRSRELSEIRLDIQREDSRGYQCGIASHLSAILKR